MQHEQDTIETIFYSEFHPQQGPIIAYSLPFNQPIQKWTEPILDYIIPKADLCNKLITMYHEEHTLITFPVFIENSRLAWLMLETFNVSGTRGMHTCSIWLLS
jgi:hypothetical protein